MRQTILRILCLGFIAASIAACAPEQTGTSTIETSCTAEGPFFAGANSLIADYTVDLSQLIEGKNLSAEQIKHIHLKQVEVSIAHDSLNLSAVSSASLQLVAENVEMTSVAVKNPIESDGKTVILESSSEVDLRDYFRQDAFTLVLDLDLLEDLYINELSASVSVELEISYTE